jgi:hypothetical protein
MIKSVWFVVGSKGENYAAVLVNDAMDCGVEVVALIFCECKGEA